MYQYAYLVGDAILAIAWLALFFVRSDLRRQQLFVGLILAPLAPLADYLWFYHDYWRPEYLIGMRIGQVSLGLESPFFIFLIGGIAAVIYEVVFRRRPIFGKPRNLMAMGIVLLVLFVTGLLIHLGLNSLWASVIAMITSAIVMVAVDRDLIYDALWSSILMFVISIVFYVIWLGIYPGAIQRFWMANAFSGVKIAVVPIEEIIWFASAGISLGILYEFWLNVKKYPRKK